MNPELLTDQELTDLLKECTEQHTTFMSLDNSKLLPEQLDLYRQYDRLLFVVTQEQKRREALALEQRIQAQGYTIEAIGPFYSTVSNGVECIEVYRPMYLEELRKIVTQLEEVQA